MKLALAGDTMLGRGVAEALAEKGPDSLFSDGVVAAAREADLFVLNLECCISERGERWPASGKPFFFRAPPIATQVLARLGVDVVTLANNHALDFGRDALLDTFEHLRRAGIGWVGAGTNLIDARRPARIDARGVKVDVVAISDHPSDFAAGRGRPGIAYVEPDDPMPQWLVGAIASNDADLVLVTPHWGPNMTPAPLPRIASWAERLLHAGADLVAGHSAHVFHGAGNRCLFDLGDFVDDYAVDPTLRNDLGLLFLVDIDASRPLGVECVPLKLDYCHTQLAAGDDWEWIRARFEASCRDLGTHVRVEDGRLVVRWS